MILLDSLEDGKEAFLPCVIGLPPGKDGEDIRGDDPPDKVVDITEMVVECHPAYAAAFRDVTDGNTGKRPLKQELLQGRGYCVPCYVAHERKISME